MAFLQFLISQAVAWAGGKEGPTGAIRAGGIVASAAGAGIHMIGGAASNIVNRELGFQFNAQFPNYVPEPTQSLATYYAGKIGPMTTRQLLRYHGIQWEPPGAPEPQSVVAQSWRRIIDALQPTLSVDVAQQLYLAGDIDPGQFVFHLDLSGLRREAKQAVIDWRPPLPLAEAIAQYHLYPSRRDFWSREVSRHGWALGERWREVVNMTRPFTPHEAAAMELRGILRPFEAEQHYAANGFVTIGAVEAWRRAAQSIPPPSDLIHFSVREVWDEAVVERFGYDDEFPDGFAFWMGKLGYDWGEQHILQVGGFAPLVKWPQAYWRSHWVAMSPSQAYVAWHRTRPENLAELRELIPDIEEFTWEDLNAALKINDYPPEVRKWLAAGSFTLPRLIDIRQAYIKGLRDREWAIRQLRNRGYLPSTAADITDLWDRMGQERARAAIERAQNNLVGKVLNQILDSYRLGYLDYASADRRLEQIGVEQPYRQTMLEHQQLLSQRKQIDDYVKAIRSAYLDGEMSEPEAVAALGGSGIVAASIPRYIAEWRNRRSFKRRMFSSSEILRYTKEGLIQPGVALARLANLGWSNADALVAVQSATAGLQTARAKAIQASERSRVSRARELEAAGRKADTLSRRIQADLRRLIPLSAMERMVKDEVVSPQYARLRMLAQGYPETDIARYLELWGAKTNGATEGGSAASDTGSGPGSAQPGTEQPGSGPRRLQTEPRSISQQPREL